MGRASNCWHLGCRIVGQEVGLEGWEAAFFQLLELLLVTFVNRLWEQPFYQVQRFLSFYNLINRWLLIREVANLLVALSRLSLLAFQVFTLVYNIFEDKDITSLKFLVFDNTSRE